MPLLTPVFKPSFLFRNAHLHTMAPSLFRKVKAAYKRERMYTGDGDFIDLDFLGNGSDTLLVMIHGLEGSSHSKYIMALANQAVQRGIDAVAVNLKGCSGEYNKEAGSYHSGKTDDLHEVFLWLKKNRDYKNYLLAGFSLGGNISLKYLGEYADVLLPELKAATVVSVPCVLEDSAYVLARRSNRVYMDRFLKTLKEKALYKIEKHGLSFEKSAIQNARNFIDFDNAFTAPVHGFSDAFDYWKRSSSRQFIPLIKTPVLMISALDDPFLSPSCFPFEEAEASTCLHLAATKYGGHVGFAGTFPFPEVFWHEKEIWRFFNNFS